MKKLLLLCLILTACATKPPVQQIVTSQSIVAKSKEQCVNVPDADLQKAACIYSYVLTYCQIFNPDTRVCGEIRRPQQQTQSPAVETSN